ncbi:MAG: NUDIX domain-containing protein [Nocardioidaceae bacterium]
MADFHVVAFVIVRDSAGRLLLARRSGVSYGDGMWGLPGGHVEPDESLIAAAARETWEEVGIRVEHDDLSPIGLIRYADDDMSGLDVYFAAERFSGEPRPVSECDAVGWYHSTELPEGSLPWLAGALQRVLVERTWFTDLVGTAPAE